MSSVRDLYCPPADDTVEQIASDAADDNVRWDAWVYERRITALLERAVARAAPPPDDDAPSARAIRAECDAVRDMLLTKNAAYGDSALDPVRVFSRADPIEALRVRIDDKLSRLARGTAAGEDVTLDLIGYLVLLRIAERAG